MSLHKLTAGSGYDYLTRQVAAQDVTEKGHTGLASYYTERGEIPGVWVGEGCSAIRDDFAGSEVTAAQMQALFGAGLNPVGADLLAALPVDATERQARTVLRLGAPFAVSDREVSDFRIQVARRVGGFNTARGLRRDAAVSVDDRARIRTEVATELFTAEHGRPPADARELSATIARHSRPRTTAVAGFDLTFSPPKSVSTLWAVADPATAARIEQAHQQAVAAALRFIEQTLLYSREGPGGVRQVEVEGLVAAAFTHRDTRAGDPDLHTHVAVANKVKTLGSGKWLAIDGRVLYQGVVAASETYNTALVKLLENQGLAFYDRPADDPRGRPVREIVGVSPELNRRWSTRRADIETRREQLVTDFQARHGRPPSPVESIKLAQQATLETRDAKHAPRTLAEQRATWHAQAVRTLGGRGSLAVMISRAFTPGGADLEHVDAAWFERSADLMLTAMQARAATWNDAHLRAEAQRLIRRADVTHDRTPAAVDYLVRLAKDRSVSLARPDTITEPEPLLRSDGASVYAVAGTELFTSAAIMAAEQSLLAVADRTDGRVANPGTVRASIAAAEATTPTAAARTVLNAGQEALVSALAGSGRRLQLAIAPAGAGKTTAMHVLTQAWTADGGTVIGLAPSAAAAAQLRDQTGTTTDTLAKLVWAIQQHDLPDWAAQVGPKHLVIVDEAGMADTPSLAAVTDWSVARGASVRLIGDDQQLAAIGAGGILRDLRTRHDAVQLTELMRFTDPAEAAASLALRTGQPVALGFYLDHGRVHVGDLTTITDHAFHAWNTDREAGLDTLMIAPTRAIVADLNRRARDQRLSRTPDTIGTLGREAQLADGNTATAGDLVITRSNDRRLRTSRTDWVKNGDRWSVTTVGRDGSLRVRHHTTGRSVTLPRTYVGVAVELGYACTIHAAQGVSVDTVHGVATGEESRQQLYTMLTRGRQQNHLWLQTASDGSPATAVHPDGTHPPTPTDLLERILARDDTAHSATSHLRDQADPRLLLGDATQRYLDGLAVAAENLAPPGLSQRLDDHAEALLPGLTDEPAWPTLWSHLLLTAHQDDPIAAPDPVVMLDPVVLLDQAVSGRDLSTAHDQAAVINWRLHEPAAELGSGPLPWLPPVPDRIADDPTYGAWLGERAKLITQLADDIRQQTAQPGYQPGWLPVGARRPDADLLAQIEIWRAATQTDTSDQRPTGPTPATRTAWTWKRRLDTQLRHSHRPALQEWRPLLIELHPPLARDPFTPELADHLAALSRAGLPAATLLHTAINGTAINRSATNESAVNRSGATHPSADQPAATPLPDDHPGAALWWRITAELHRHHGGRHGPQEQIGIETDWADRLPELVGDNTARDLRDSPYWPLLVDHVDDALDRGWPLDRVVSRQAPHPTMDSCLALVCTIGATTTPADTGEPEPDEDSAPDDLYDDWTPADLSASQPPTPSAATLDELHDSLVDAFIDSLELDQPAGSDHQVDVDLHIAGLVRDHLGPPEPTDGDLRRMFDRADAWRDSPVSRERLLTVNQLTQQYFSTIFDKSWAQDYLFDRIGADLTNHPTVAPGYAPPGWTHLVDHLRRHGVTDQEMITAGVARVASTGNLIDQLRDRLILPITHDGDILGFVGRRHPRHDVRADRPGRDTAGGPKYLNTPDTPLFHKGDQFYRPTLLGDRPNTTTVIVEGPLDAIAVSLGTRGRYIGIAPLGTSLTEQQAARLTGRTVIIATDNDPAGHTAAERDYWRLTPHTIDPQRAHLLPGTDPASVLASYGPDRLTAILDDAHPQADTMMNDRIAGLPRGRALDEASKIVAARPSPTWAAGIALLAEQFSLEPSAVREKLLRQVRTWNADPRAAADQAIERTRLPAQEAPTAPACGPQQKSQEPPKSERSRQPPAITHTRSASPPQP